MAIEGGPYIPLGILLDKSHSAKKAVRVLGSYQTQYNRMIVRTAYETILGNTDEVNIRRIKSRDLLVKMDKLTEQLKDYENFKAEGKGKKGRFVVDDKKLKALISTKGQRERVDADIAEITRRLHEASR